MLPESGYGLLLTSILELESAAADTAAKRKQNRPQAEDVVMPKSPTDMTGDSGPTPKRPRADNSQIHSALAEGERETIDSEDDEADEDLGEEVGEEVGDEVLEISGEEDVDEDMDEIDALTGGHASDEHVEIEDEAIDTSDSD